MSNKVIDTIQQTLHRMADRNHDGRLSKEDVETAVAYGRMQATQVLEEQAKQRPWAVAVAFFIGGVIVASMVWSLFAGKC